MTITCNDLHKILESHRQWLNDPLSGTRANLTRADLTRADLTGANLTWTNLTGANLIPLGVRSDGYVFYAIHEPASGNVMIRAGCRYNTIDAMRLHWTQTRAGSRLGEESQALVDHGERMAKIAGWIG